MHGRCLPQGSRVPLSVRGQRSELQEFFEVREAPRWRFIEAHAELVESMLCDFIARYLTSLYIRRGAPALRSSGQYS